MSLETRILSTKDIDFDEVVSLHRNAFSQLLTLEESRRIHCPDYFLWKWSSPDRPGLIAVATDQHKYVAMNAMTWNWLHINTQNSALKVGTWLSSDTATAQAYRGRGLFQKCLLALSRQVQSDEFFAGFPNSNSLPGFLKAGWNPLTNMKTYIRPILQKGKVRQNFQQILDKGDLQKLSPFKQNEQSFSRQATWLKWRYVHGPLCPYQIFKVDNYPTPLAIVVREYERRGFRFLVVMDWLNFPIESAIDPSTELGTSLVNDCIDSIGKALNCHFAFTQTTIRPFFIQTFTNWFSVPDIFLPKKQIFAGNLPPALQGQTLKFNLNLGDWDGL